MRIGFEISNVTTDQPTGIARYITEVIAAIARQKAADDELSLWYKLSRWPKRRSWWRPTGLRVRVHQGRWWPPLKGIDLVHGMDASIPDWAGVKRVATVHDLLVLLQDDEEIAREEFRFRKRRLYERLAASVDAVIAVSHNTRQDVINVLDVPEERVHVTHLGIDPCFSPRPEDEIARVLARHGLAPGYLLFVGAIASRKNTERLVRAYARSQAARERLLVLAGSLSYRGDHTLEAIRECGVGDQVVILGYTADRDLPALYSGAGAFVFPTLYEGFGIPILEAMACGTPVLIGDRGAAPEIAGGHAVVVDPFSLDAIADGMDRVLETSSAAISAAKNHVRSFTWDNCARQTLNVYRRVLGS